MNIIVPNLDTEQALQITPRAHEDGVYQMLLYSEGKNEPETIPIVHGIVIDGSFMTFDVVIDAKKNAQLYFVVQCQSITKLQEIYRGKAFASDSAEPLKHSIYGS